MHASHVTEGLFYYQVLVDTGVDGGRTPTLILWLGIDLLVTERLRGEIRSAVESNEQCAETWLVFPIHLAEQVNALIDGEVRDRFANEAGFTYRLISVDGRGEWSELERIGSDTHGIDSTEIPALAPEVWHNGLRQIFRDTESLYSSGPAFHFAKPSGAHTSYFLRASETANHNLHASFVAACLLSEIDRVPVRILSDTAGVHSILFHLRTLLEQLRDAPIVPIDSFGGYESFDEWVSLISTDDLIIISSSTSGELARKIVERLRANTPPIVTLYYLSKETPNAHRTLCDLTFRGEGEFRTSGVLGSYYQHLPPSHGLNNDCDMCKQRVPVLQLEGDNFVPRPDGLELRMVTIRVFDRRPIDAEHRGGRQQNDFFSDFYGLDVVHMHADHEADRESRRQFKTHIAHLLKDSETLGAPFRAELLRIRDTLQTSLGMESVDLFVSTPDIDSKALARWLAAETFGAGAANPSARVFARSELAIQEGDLFDTLASIPSGSNVIGVSSVVSTGRSLLDLSRSLRVASNGIKIGYLAAIGHPPSLNSWQILLNSLRWTAPDEKSDFQFGWLLERDPLEIGAETAWTAELRLAERLMESEPEGSPVAVAAASRIEEIRARPIGSRRLFADPAFDGVNDVEMRPINRGFMAWNFDYIHQDRRDGRGDASQAEVFAAVSHMLHRSRFANADTAAGRLSTRLPGFVLDPANFDRYNDPQIQAAILRSAHPGELDYRSDEDGSRAMTEVVLHSIANLEGEAGDVAAEFVIALLIGLNPTPRSGLNLRPDNLAEVVRRVELLEQCADLPIGPYLRGLIRLMLTAHAAQ